MPWKSPILNGNKLGFLHFLSSIASLNIHELGEEHKNEMEERIHMGTWCSWLHNLTKEKVTQYRNHYILSFGALVPIPKKLHGLSQHSTAGSQHQLSGSHGRGRSSIATLKKTCSSIISAPWKPRHLKDSEIQLGNVWLWEDTQFLVSGSGRGLT